MCFPLALLVYRCLSSTASFVSCVFRRVKDHRNLPKYSPLLKRACVGQVVLDKWFPLNSAATLVGEGRGGEGLRGMMGKTDAFRRWGTNLQPAKLGIEAKFLLRTSKVCLNRNVASNTYVLIYPKTTDAHGRRCRHALAKFHAINMIVNNITIIIISIIHIIIIIIMSSSSSSSSSSSIVGSRICIITTSCL